MAYENKPGDGVLFPNERKTEDKHPSMTGFILAHRDIKAGEKLDLAAWTKEGRTKFLSLRMSDVRTREEAAPAGGPDLSDDIPFLPERRV